MENILWLGFIRSSDFLLTTPQLSTRSGNGVLSSGWRGTPMVQVDGLLANYSSMGCREFGPSKFEDSGGALFKLSQTGTVKDYIAEFRRLANRK